jgi:hypothetical protein
MDVNALPGMVWETMARRREFSNLAQARSRNVLRDLSTGHEIPRDFTFANDAAEYAKANGLRTYSVIPL